MPLDPAAAARDQVGAAAAARIEAGMRLGIGTGRAVAAFLLALQPRIAAGLRVEGVATSIASEQLARAAGVALLDDGWTGPLDLDVDGADELGPQLACLKGGGGALLREKVVAQASGRFWVIAEAGKRVDRLGTSRALPVEVLPFGWAATAQRLTDLGADVVRRGDPRPTRTDNGNFILDCAFPGGLHDPERLAASLDQTPGVLGHGLFLGLATAAFLSDGRTVELCGDPRAER
ncbi:MAG TPA: ribose-5-phosphate isomerase RpiA [Candidatus Dormibacteraeota bacterium]|nr:ribose-5-phosphate isomerase RpiA [Candidatus Dormibacteraeota bacterium]